MRGPRESVYGSAPLPARSGPPQRQRTDVHLRYSIASNRRRPLLEQGSERRPVLLQRYGPLGPTRHVDGFGSPLHQPVVIARQILLRRQHGCHRPASRPRRCGPLQLHAPRPARAPHPYRFARSARLHPSPQTAGCDSSLLPDPAPGWRFAHSARLVQREVRSPSQTPTRDAASPHRDQNPRGAWYRTPCS